MILTEGFRIIFLIHHNHIHHRLVHLQLYAEILAQLARLVKLGLLARLD
jgi:hypothetical protein